ncbi:TIGR01777 family oxidoreductase [Brevibacillus sp. B_LB10_24]|uniref:TIGR01777 family oxidoreductase n=1 Tax=Brevibacillus sp. B_LB10_24 TaxID=3380645 RepID=UPI0038B8B569
MKIAVTGATGFIGKHLARHLVSQGDEVIAISRSAGGQGVPNVKVVRWDELTDKRDMLEGLDAVVNLAGESINQRWTPSAKERIVSSRRTAAEKLAELFDRLEHKPPVLINASGISIYGTSDTDTYDESSPARIVDFLSDVVEKWEAAADLVSAPRTVKIRVGIVLGNDGGAYPKMALPYKLGVGGKVGSGSQWLSWIHIEDMVRLIDFCIRNEQVSGPVNATAPNPVTNDQFGRAVARGLGRPHWFPVPAALMKLIFGELAVLLLEGQRVFPQKLLDCGFQFRYPGIDDAIKQLAGK